MIRILSKPIDCVVIDFDKTLIRENLLMEWVLFILLESNLNSRDKLSFLLKSFCRGLTSILLSRYSCRSEQAVRIAYSTFHDVPAANIHELIMMKSRWKRGYAINLNADLLEILQKILAAIRCRTWFQPKIIITSQGSFTFAIRTFLGRQDVVEQMTKAGVSIDLTDKDAIIANRLDVSNNRFTGKLIPPVITKHNRLKLFPENALFVGDGKDESTLKRMGKSDVTFINYKKIAALDW